MRVNVDLVADFLEKLLLYNYFCQPLYVCLSLFTSPACLYPVVLKFLELQWIDNCGKPTDIRGHYKAHSSSGGKSLETKADSQVTEKSASGR